MTGFLDNPDSPGPNGPDRPGPAGGDIARQLAGYRLTTARILYHMPDHPGLLQSYVWQALDIAPKFPELRRFLDFWSRNLDGKLHSVQVAAKGLISPAEMRLPGLELRLH
ncbi:MAG: hypothetical protein RLY86_1284 [Pseudomonadota bacterium]|jgi:uncharacterized protein Usg